MKKTPESGGDVIPINRGTWCSAISGVSGPSKDECSTCSLAEELACKELEVQRRRAKEALTTQSELTGKQYDATLTIADYMAVLEARLIRLINETRESRVSSSNPLESGEAIGEIMSQFAETFHTLVDKLGVRPWDPQKLDEWAKASPAVTTGSLHAARFVLSVWDPNMDWECGKFYSHHALAGWDEHHRAAFQAWVNKPWWP